MAARHKQIGERAGHEQAVGVLCEPAIAHLGKAEHPLDDPDRMFDPRFREGRLWPALWTWSDFRPLDLIYDHRGLAEILSLEYVLPDHAC